MPLSDEIFKRIEARLSTIDPNDRKVLHVFKFTLTDDDGAVIKSWILDLKDVKLYECTDDTQNDAECSLKLKESTMMAIVDGTLDSTKALNDDLIDVEGDLELIYLLKPYISTV